MYRNIRVEARVVAASLILCGIAGGTVIPRLSFEELTDSSDAVVSGIVTRSWPAWDSAHRYVWTHYELNVSASHKGNTRSTIEFAEPGGALDGVVHVIAGMVTYQPGEHVSVFLQRMPNGYLRTTGWGQGKFGVDTGGRLRAASALRTVELVNFGKPLPGATSLETLDGITVGELNSRVASRIRATKSTSQSKARAQ